MAAVLFAVAAVLSGCTKDELGGGNGGSEDGLKDFEISTYATVNNDANARTGEDKIFSAMVYIYQAGTDKLDNADSREVSVLTSIGEVVDNNGKLNKTWRVPVGNKDVYVVANPRPELKTRLTASLTQAQLQALLTADSNREFMETIGDIPTKGMLMSGKKLNVAVSPEFAKVTGTVEVTRRMARIEFMLRKSKELEGSTVKVTHTEYGTLANHGSVYPSVVTTTGITNYNPGASTTTITAQQATAGVWSGTAADYTPVSYAYSYESAAGRKAVRIIMRVDIDGKEYKLPVYLCSTSIGTNKIGNDENKPVALEANKIYRVMATLGKQTTDVTLDILDWNDVSVNGDIYGGELAVSQNKIAMDWWNLGESFSTTLSVTASENIEFVGYQYGTGAITSALDANAAKWLTVAGVTSNTDKTENITLTYNLDNTTGKEPVYMWFRAGNIKKRVEIVYDNGYITRDMLVAQGWTNAPSKGIHVNKTGLVYPTGTSSSETDIQWAAVTTSVPASQHFGYGMANTDAIIAALGSDATAANACRALGREWYLPSKDELSEAVYPYKDYMGSSYAFTSYDYWSSTELSSSTSNAWYVQFGLNGTSAYGGKTNKTSVRCLINHELLLIEKTSLVADYWNWGQSFTKKVPFTSKDGAVSIQSIDNGSYTKDWLVSATVTGSTSGTIDITYQPTAGGMGVHDDVAIIVTTAGGETKTITVKYDNGYITHDMLVAKGWADAPANGIHVNKIGLVHPSGTAGALSGQQKAWATVSTSVPGAQQTGYGYGPANTSVIITTLGDNAPAANACRTLGSEWYLPSKDELSEALYPYKNYMGGSYVFGSYIYWSSTEDSSSTSWGWYKHFGNGKMTSGNKAYTSVHVRCVCDL